MRSKPFAMVLFVLGAAASACTHYGIQTPSGFAELQHQQPTYAYRAASAYGVGISVHQEPNAEHGNLDFWSETVDRHLQRTGPYHPAGRAEVRTDAGTIGRRLAYTYGDPQSGGTYWVTVFVSRKRVFLLEAGGPTDAFARAQPSVERAIQSFHGG